MDVTAAVARGDLDELQRVIDACCERRDWEALATLRDRAAQAHDRGHQLWPIATQAEYRLALEAPAEHAARVLVEGSGRFALGPLPEVAASSHTWSELAPHVRTGPSAVLALHERVARGEDCTAGPLPGPPVLELPRRPVAWEPRYLLAEYRADRAHFPAPDPLRLEAVELPRAPAAARDQASDALVELAATWTEDSNGRAAAVRVTGSALEAIAALGVPRARVAPITTEEAVVRMAWAAASGGAHARRPGAASGRFGAWWALAALAGRLDPWPPDPEDLGAAADGLAWLAWDAHEPPTGWELRLAVADRHGTAWAVTAVDAA